MIEKFWWKLWRMVDNFDKDLIKFKNISRKYKKISRKSKEFFLLFCHF